MIATTLIFAIELVILRSYAVAVPLSSVEIFDNGLGGRITHDGDSRIGGLFQGHYVRRRSFGSQDYSNSEDSDDETVVETETRFSGHPHGFNGNYPHRPHGNRHFPGAVPPPFRKFDHSPGMGWNQHGDFPYPCHGPQCGNKFGHRHHHHHHHPPGQRDKPCNFNEGSDEDKTSSTTTSTTTTPATTSTTTTPATTITTTSTDSTYAIDIRLGQ